MTIPFVPIRGHILICDLSFGLIAPELGKERRVVVVSPRSYNHRHGVQPGRCVVVPFSETLNEEPQPAHVPFDATNYKSLTHATWALCDCVRSVSHARLNRVRGGGENLNEIMSQADLARLEVGLLHAVGIAKDVE
jgi:uncharacterized protein YifN (PemK superfamily)